MINIVFLAIAVTLVISDTTVVSNRENCQPQSSCLQTWFVEERYTDNGDDMCVRGPDVGYILEYDANQKELNLACSSCATKNDTTSTTYLGYCPSNSMTLETSLKTRMPMNSSDLNAELCGRLHREGLLCKNCRNGFGPAVLSQFSQCIECNRSYSWVLFILHAFFPTSIFLVIILVLRINAVSPSLNAFILWCQTIANILFLNPACFSAFFEYTKSTFGSFTYNFAIISTAVGGLWNLDFFRYTFQGVCLSSNINLLSAVALEYVVALYPLGFTALLYYAIQWHDNDCKVLVWMWQPVNRLLYRFSIKLNFKASVLNSFITFLVLSYSKLLTISVSLLRVTSIYDSCGEKVRPLRVYLDPEMKAFGSAHLCFAIPAVAVIFFANVLPVLYIFLYTFRKLKRQMDFMFRSMLWKELAKSCQKDFKDGFDGSQDCRFFASLYLLARCLFIVILQEKIGTLVVTLLSLGFGALILGFKPYKVNAYNYIDLIIVWSVSGSSFLFFLAQMKFLSDRGFALFYIFLFIPMVYFIFLICWKLGQKIRICSLLNKCLWSFWRSRSFPNFQLKLDSPVDSDYRMA